MGSIGSVSTSQQVFQNQAGSSGFSVLGSTEHLTHSAVDPSDWQSYRQTFLQTLRGTRTREGSNAQLLHTPDLVARMDSQLGPRRSRQISLQRLSKSLPLYSALTAFFLMFVLIQSLSPPREPEVFSSDNTFGTIPRRTQRKSTLPSLPSERQRDRAMPDYECRREFPLLYPQLEVLEAYWRKRGGITKQMLDENEKGGTDRWGFVRLIISEGQLRVRAFRADDSTRTSALVYMIEKAVHSWPEGYGQGLEDLPPTDLILSAGDLGIFPGEGYWGVTRRIDDPGAVGQWLIPDFGFTGWPEAGISSFDDFLSLSAEVEDHTPWKNKDQRLFWRGFPHVYAIRKDLLDRAGVEGHPERGQWSDVYPTTFDKNLQGSWKPIVPIAEHCRYKYLIHVEGNSYSGRSRYLLACDSVVVAHKMVWTQHFHPALISDPSSKDQNLVELPGPGFNGLEEAAYLLRGSDGSTEAAKPATPFSEEDLQSLREQIIGRKGARRVAENAVRTLRDRYLSTAATMCYTRAALRSYAKVLNRNSWGSEAFVRPGQGVAPDSRKGKLTGQEKGDIEVGIWRLFGTPDWPPPPKGNA